MLLTILKNLNIQNRKRKLQKREKRAKKRLLKEMSFNRDLGFRYLSSTPPQRTGSELLKRKYKQGKLHRSQSELTLNNIDGDNSALIYGGDHLSDVGDSMYNKSHRSVSPTGRLRNHSMINSKKFSSLNEDESEDPQDEPQKPYKSKKKSKKHRRSIATPGFTQQLSNSSESNCDNNNNNINDISRQNKDKDDVPDNWMPLFLPSYKSRLSKFQRTFEEIPPNEKLVDDYLCALRRDMLLQGRLYISVNYIAFHSNILGYETFLVIKFSDVTKITKATTLKVFPNAIEIHTTSGEKHILTSFVSRERAFALMLKLWQNSNDSSEKITWTEICKYIRNSYITDTLPRDLSELDELDLADDVLVGKSVTKKLQTKKEKLKLLEVERTHHRSDSQASFLSAFEYLPDESSAEHSEKPNSDRLTSVSDNSPNETDISSKWCESIRTILPGVIGESIVDGVQYCANERNIVRVCVIVSVVLLIVQLLLLCWVTLFESKINSYERILIDTLAHRRAQLQQHSILTDSV